MSERSENTARHIFTVDVEEYFQVEAFSKYILREEWGTFPNRVLDLTSKLLDMLEQHGIQATFFVLGWLAEKNPELVRRISGAGHEIASHGHEHTMITRMTPSDFRRDVRKSREILQEITGADVRGYRAPTFSIMEKTAWAHSILLEEGYRYSSSVFPTRHDRYGWEGFGPRPRVVASNGVEALVEVPMSVCHFGGISIPFAGGGYLRAYPLILTKILMNRSEKDGRSVVFYVHPWELDVRHPKVKAPWFRRLRHYHRISTVERKLESLLRHTKFISMGAFVEMMQGSGNRQNVGL